MNYWLLIPRQKKLLEISSYIQLANQGTPQNGTEMRSWHGWHRHIILAGRQVPLEFQQLMEHFVQNSQLIFDTCFTQWRKNSNPHHVSIATRFIVFVMIFTLLLMLICLCVWIKFQSIWDMTYLVLLIPFAIALHSMIAILITLSQETVQFARLLTVLTSLPSEATFSAVKRIDSELLQWEIRDKYFVFDGFLVEYQRIKQVIFSSKHVIKPIDRSLVENSTYSPNHIIVSLDQEIMCLRSGGWLASSRTPNTLFMISYFTHAFTVMALIFLFLSQNSIVPLIISTICISSQVILIVLFIKHLLCIKHHRYFLDRIMTLTQDPKDDDKDKAIKSFSDFLSHLSMDDVFWLFGSRYFVFMNKHAPQS